MVSWPVHGGLRFTVAEGLHDDEGDTQGDGDEGCPAIGGDAEWRVAGGVDSDRLEPAAAEPVPDQVDAEGATRANGAASGRTDRPCHPAVECSYLYIASERHFVQMFQEQPANERTRALYDERNKRPVTISVGQYPTTVGISPKEPRSSPVQFDQRAAD